MESISIQYYQCPFGELILGTFKDQLCLADWRYRKMREQIDRRIQDGLKAEYREEESDCLQEVFQQLEDYFKGDRKTFDLPLLFVGTDFQKRVWKSLTEIPFGKTSTYLELSKKLGDTKAIRAVASANGANAISIIVPCHRIIGSDGKLVGYAGGLSAKRRLLELENGSKQSKLF